MSAPIASSAAWWTAAGSASPHSTNGRPSASSVVAWPAPQASPSTPAPRRPPRRSDKTMLETAVRWSGSVAWRSPSRTATSSASTSPPSEPQPAIRSSSPSTARSSRIGGGDGGLAERDAAVVGGQALGHEHAQPGAREPLRGRREQDAVLEHAAGEDDRAEPARAPPRALRRSRWRRRARGGSARRSRRRGARAHVGGDGARSSPARRARARRPRCRARPRAGGTRRAPPGRRRPRARPRPGPRR